MTYMNQTRAAVIDALDHHLAPLSRALDVQARALLRKDNVSVIGAMTNDRGHVELIAQYDTGEVHRFTRNDLLPDGDDGASLAYQANIVERLALEYEAAVNALDAAKRAAYVLNTPPVPADAVG